MLYDPKKWPWDELCQNPYSVITHTFWCPLTGMSYDRGNCSQLSAMGVGVYAHFLDSISVKNLIVTEGMPCSSHVWAARCLEVTLEKFIRLTVSLTHLFTIIVFCLNCLCRGWYQTQHFKTIDNCQWVIFNQKTLPYIVVIGQDLRLLKTLTEKF